MGLDVHIIDNLLPDFNEYVGRVSSINFRDVENQGIKYNDMSQDISGDVIYNVIEKKLGFKPINKINFLRAYRNRDHKHKMWIHSDVLFADYIAVFMVQPSIHQQDDAIAFWRNKELDDIQLYTKDHTGEKNKVVDSQTLDPDLWEMWKRVEFKQNRIVIAPAAYFHSKATYGNPSNLLKDSRIVHVLFFDKGEENV